MRANQWRKGLVVGVLALVALGLISLIWGLVGKMRIAMTEAHSVEQQYQSLEARKATLQANMNALATPQGQDAALRTAFGVARPGEEVIVVLPPEAPTTTPPVPWWQQVLNWF
jgi:cell division protein FtsB